jgi:MerR family transcriptional regulator, redox-sensitive transcriptional activator SoxR
VVSTRTRQRDPTRLSIGEVAKRAGLAASALRYYEREGLIPVAPQRGGRRVYDASILERLALIELCKRAGFGIGEIKRLLAGVGRRTPPGERWRTLGEKKLAELDLRIVEAERMKQVLRIVMRCECPTLDDCARAIERSER